MSHRSAEDALPATPKARPSESAHAVVVLYSPRLTDAFSADEGLAPIDLPRRVAEFLGPAAKLVPVDQKRCAIYLSGATARSIEARVRALVTDLRDQGRRGIVAGVLGVGPGEVDGSQALRTATRLARDASYAGPDGLIVADQIWTRDGESQARPHMVPSHDHSLLSRVAQIIVVVAAWVLFFIWWATVSAGMPTRRVLLDAVVPVLVGLGLIIILTIVWTAHNKRIARQGNRGMVARWTPPDLSRDALGRSVEVLADDLARGPVKRTVLDALILRQQIDASAAIKCYQMERVGCERREDGGHQVSSSSEVA